MTAQRCLTHLPEVGSGADEQICSALYLHVPFCLQKCPYCSFFSLAGAKNLQKIYVQAVSRQIRQVASNTPARLYRLKTIFFGGGTPTILSADILADILNSCLDAFPCNEEKRLEISIEANPATTDIQGLRTLRRAGFNRLSIGVQSFNDQELRLLGRPHSALDARRIFHNARQAGFTNINLDLMYGLPGQTTEDWQQSLERALALAPEHLSLYELTIEEDTVFGAQKSRGLLHLPREEEVLAMLAETEILTRQAGFLRYEISNYARAGFQCQHNINYWHNRSYIGLGPGAVTCLDDTRYTAAKDIEQFARQMNAEQTAWRENERLTREERFRETVIMGLRMLDGVSLKELKQRFGINLVNYYGSTLTSLIEQQLLVIDQERLHLTSRGLLLANTVMAELV